MLAIASGKGGCGKTTTALGIATATAEAGTPTQVVDLDIEMPDLHVLAGVDRQGSASATGRGALQASVAPAPAPGRPGVSVVPAPHCDDERLLEEALANLPQRPTVLDVPAGVGESAIRPLRIASQVLLVTRPNPETIEDTIKTATIAREIGTNIAGLAVRSADPLPDGFAEQFDLDPAAVYRLPNVDGPPLADDRVQQTYRLISSRSREKGFITPCRTSIDT